MDGVSVTVSLLALCSPAIAAAVEHWQEMKEQGKIQEPPEEEDIYASARIGQVACHLVCLGIHLVHPLNVSIPLASFLCHSQA